MITFSKGMVGIYYRVALWFSKGNIAQFYEVLVVTESEKRYFYNTLAAVKCLQVVWSIPSAHND